MNDSEFTSDQFDDVIGMMTDNELVDLMRKIADEVELRFLYGVPLDENGDL